MLSVTVDVDGAAGLPRGGAGYEHRLSCWSERTYGITAGLPRILGVLAEFAAPATFYVPGRTAERHPDEIAALAHEVGHHGHTHRFPNTLSADDQRAEIIEGSAALTAITGTTPRGYRAPGWELTRVTLDTLGAAGFAWDSSLMGDDRPYVIDAGGTVLVELPVHWTLDDAPHFAHTTDPSGLVAVWLAELDAATRENRHLTVTLHPEILGRPHRVDILRRLLDHAEGAFATHGEIATVVATP